VRNCFQAATISLDTLAMAFVTRAQMRVCYCFATVILKVIFILKNILKYFFKKHKKS
jgi:hypothetical protein